MDTFAYRLLHPKLQQAVQKLGWQRLYPIQEMAIRVILEETSDCIVCAPTSGGKSEAVIFPVL